MRRVYYAMAPPANCTNLRDSYKSIGDFMAYKEANFNTSSLGTYTTSSAENVGKLQIMESKVEAMTSCIQKEMIQRQEIASQIYDLQKLLQEKRKEADAKISIAKDAKERAGLLDHPYEKTTIWESWFPLGRPLHQSSVPVLLSFAILFLILALGMFLRLAAIEFQLKIPFLNPVAGGYTDVG